MVNNNLFYGVTESNFYNLKTFCKLLASKIVNMREEGTLKRSIFISIFFFNSASVLFTVRLLLPESLKTGQSNHSMI